LASDRRGSTPQLTKRAATAAAAATSPLVLVHGYCAGSNPFLATPSAWTDYHTFGDFGKSRTNDEFARLIGDFAKAKGLDSGFAGVGHSQGGIALTHLMCTYWSGMDTTRLVEQAARNMTGKLGSGTRIVQSVGTPYKGCSGAGAGASLIKIFGVGCGSNDDLTPDGAALWLSTVSEACAADTYYYTTTYKLKGGSWLGEWCNLATSMVLEAPNDGTTELVFADLPGGHNMGNVESECHTTDMVYPPQTDDAKRNVELNANAAGRV
jgi:pimeloyl-ACP methyl ester carboxylesterase